jgi:hypothetical protein
LERYKQLKMSDYKQLKHKVINALDKLYTKDNCLFTRNDSEGLAERCIVFRLAYYLQHEYEHEHEYFVDCDFNSSCLGDKQISGKPISNSDGSTTKRFIDIILHKRDFRKNANTDFACFEIKKWNNQKKDAIEKDRNNLQMLTREYGYKYGFHIILAKKIEKVKVEVFPRSEQPRSLTWEEFLSE